MIIGENKYHQCRRSLFPKYFTFASWHVRVQIRDGIKDPLYNIIGVQLVFNIFNELINDNR